MNSVVTGPYPAEIRALAKDWSAEEASPAEWPKPQECHAALHRRVDLPTAGGKGHVRREKESAAAPMGRLAYFIAFLYDGTPGRAGGRLPAEVRERQAV